ncbi:MAG: hypothetical protein ACC707_09680, partial [Thiohalomonadales bacterium]
MTENQESEFDIAVNRLTEFTDFFSSKESSDQLVEWIHDDLGINRSIARLLVKKLSPWVLSRARKAGQKVGAAWMDKLHQKLSSQIKPYRMLTTDISTLLLAKVKDSKSSQQIILNRKKKVDAILKCTESANQLMADDVQWQELDDHQKAWVALSAGNEQTHNLLNVLSNDLQSLQKYLTPTLDLTLDIDELSDTNETNFSWFRFRRRQTKLIGRNSEQQQLSEFYSLDDVFQWWVLVGDGGIGKSRLALESAIKLESYWDCGFLQHEQLEKTDLRQWRPSNATFIMIDYAAAYGSQIAKLLDALIRNRDDFYYPVRVLLIERHTKDQPWWKELLPERNEGDIRKKYLHNEKLLTLAPLKPAHQHTLLRLFLKATGKPYQSLPENNTDPFWHTLEEITDHGRPLFIAIVAVTITTEGYDGIRKWRIKDLLQRHLVREQEMWQRQFELNANQLEECKTIFALATLCGGLDFTNDKCEIIDTIKHYQLIQLDNFETIARQLKIQSRQHKAFALEPDIFGEYFLLDNLIDGDFSPDRTKNILFAAWSYKKVACAQVIARCVMDFVDSTSPLLNWLALLQTHDNKSASNNLIISALLYTTAYYYGESKIPQLKIVIKQLEQVASSFPDNTEIQLQLV